MINRTQVYRWALPTLLAILTLSACTGQSGTPTETVLGTGEVKEVTLVDTVEASGSISPRQVASVGWETSGAIADVATQVGQQVESGDILMTLDPNSVPNSLILAQLNLVEMTSPTAISAAQNAVIEAQNAVDDAQVDRNNLDYVNQGAIDDAYAQYVLAEQKFQAAKENFDRLSYKSEDDPGRAMAYQSMYAAQVSRDSALYKYNSLSGKPTNLSYEEADSTLTMAQYRLEEAQNYLKALLGEEVPPDATGDSLLKLKETRMTVDSLNLRAPFAGTVSAIYDQEGIVVANNRSSVVLVDRSKLYVTVQLTENDVVRLSIGNSASIIVEALPELALTGKVITINPIGVVDQGVVYYDVQVELDQANDQIPLNSTASVTIQIGEPQLGLAVPVSAIQSDDQGEYVLISANGGSQRVEVVSGRILEDDTVVIQGDVEVGDQVVLVQQSTSSTTTGSGVGGAGFLMGRQP
ncbi:MAG: efflux RND transporter periplasmic adaptor subunit [Bellilinea sp.]